MFLQVCGMKLGDINFSNYLEGRGENTVPIILGGRGERTYSLRNIEVTFAS